jgi:hypothetical protein
VDGVLGETSLNHGFNWVSTGFNHTLNRSIKTSLITVAQGFPAHFRLVTIQEVAD